MNVNEFRAGTVLSTSFSIWLKNLIPFTLLSLIVFAPGGIAAWLWFEKLVSNGGQATETEIAAQSWVIVIIFSLLSYVVTGTIVYGTFQQLRGRHAGIGDAIAQGLKRLPAVVLVGIVTFIIVNGPVFLAEMIGLASPALGGILGLIARIVTIVLSMMLFVAIPASVVERPGVLGAIKRSKDLTDGCKGRIFGANFLLGIMAFVVGFIIYKITLSDNLTLDALYTFLYAVAGLGVLFYTLQAVLSAVVYHDLRQAKEGVGIEELARVFD